MDTLQTTGVTSDVPHYHSTAHPSSAIQPDQYHRAQICALVFDLVAAAHAGKIAEYLQPIPITRIHAAQRAFQEIGASQLASALHAAQFSLTKVGVRVPFAQAIATLTAAFNGYGGNIDQLVTRYTQARITRMR